MSTVTMPPPNGPRNPPAYRAARFAAPLRPDGGRPAAGDRWTVPLIPRDAYPPPGRCARRRGRPAAADPPPAGRSPRGSRAPAASGRGRLLLVGSQHHRHVAAVLLGPLLDDGELLELLREAVEDHLPALRMGHLAPAEHDRHLDLVARLQEALDMALLGVVVVLGDLRPELDLPDRDLLLVLARGLLALGLLVLVLRVVQHPAHGRLGVGRDLDEVEIPLLGVAERLGRLQDAHLLAVWSDETDLWHADALVDTGRVALRE